MGRKNLTQEMLKGNLYSRESEVGKETNPLSLEQDLAQIENLPYTSRFLLHSQGCFASMSALIKSFQIITLFCKLSVKYIHIYVICNLHDHSNTSSSQKSLSPASNCLQYKLFYSVQLGYKTLAT